MCTQRICIIYACLYGFVDLIFDILPLDELLPSVHDVWSGLSKRFLDSEPLVVLKVNMQSHIIWYDIFTEPYTL